MKYSVFSVIMPEFTLEETVKKLAEAGYDGVEWRVKEISSEYEEETPSFWRNNRSTINIDTILEEASFLKKMSGEQGLEICSLATYLEIKEISKIEKVARAARVMNCPQFRVSAPAYDRTINYNLLYDQAVKDLKEVEKIAIREKVKVILETHPGNIIPSASLAYRLVSHFDPRYIGIIYDPGNMVYEGMENWRMGLELLGEYLAHIHVKNSAWYNKDGKWAPTHVKVAEGIVDWKQLLEDISAVGYHGYLSLEDFSDTPVEEKLVSSLEYLRLYFFN